MTTERHATARPDTTAPHGTEHAMTTRINDMTTEQIDTLILGQPLDTVRHYDWIDNYPELDDDGLITAIYDVENIPDDLRLVDDDHLRPRYDMSRAESEDWVAGARHDGTLTAHSTENDLDAIVANAARNAEEEGMRLDTIAARDALFQQRETLRERAGWPGEKG